MPPAQNEAKAVPSAPGASSLNAVQQSTNPLPSSQHQPNLNNGSITPIVGQRPACGGSLSPLSPTSRSSAHGREARPRSSTVNSYTSGDGDGYESSSSGDSMLSYWSADGGSDSESDTDTSAPSLSVSTSTKPNRPLTIVTSGGDSKKGKQESDKVEKEAERKRREEERSKVLELAGLKIRREPPGVPGQPVRKGTRRRPAPPPGGGKGKGKRRAAPGVPQSATTAQASTTLAPVRVHDGDSQDKQEEKEVVGGTAGAGEQEVKMDTLDAYARYENYLAQAQTRQSRSRSGSHPTPRSNTPSSVALSGTVSSPLATQQTNGSHGQLAINRQARSSSITQSPQAGGGGRFSGLISRIMAPTSSSPGGAQEPRKSISIVRVDESRAGKDGNESGGGVTMSDTADVGRTWTSLVESSVLGTMSDKERKRQEVGPDSWSLRNNRPARDMDDG